MYRSLGEVANAAVCKTVIRGCKSHSDLHGREQLCSLFF